MIPNINYMVYNPLLIKDEVSIIVDTGNKVNYTVSGCFRTCDENVLIYDLVPITPLEFNPISIIFKITTGEFFKLYYAKDVEIPISKLKVEFRYYKSNFECDYICNLKSKGICDSCPVVDFRGESSDIFYLGDKIRIITEDGRYPYKTDLLGLDIEHNTNKFRCIYSLSPKDVVQKNMESPSEYSLNSSKYTGVSENLYRYNWRIQDKVGLYYRGGFTLNSNPCNRCIFSNCNECQVEKLGLRNVFKILEL